MALSTDSLAIYPYSGSNEPNKVYDRTVTVYNSASLSVIYHPGGTLADGFIALPENLNRMSFVLVNSGSLTLRLAFGTNYLSSSNGLFAQKVGANATFSTDTPTTRFTGNIYAMWEGSGTLSGSSLVISELFA